MNYNDAIELKRNNGHLIGQKFKGGTIEEIIIRPTDEEEYDIFVKFYLRTMNAELSIQPFLNSELTVDVVCDKDKITTKNIFLRTGIENLLGEKLNVKL